MASSSGTAEPTSSSTGVIDQFIGGVTQPAVKKCRKTHMMLESTGTLPIAEKTHPDAVASLIIPPVLQPIKKNLATSIPIGGDFTDEEFKASIAKDSYVQWRKNKSLPELTKMQTEHVYCVLQGLIAMYHEDIPMYWFRDEKINVPKAELLYQGYCQGALPLTKLGQWANVSSKYAMKLLAWAIRRKHQAGEKHFQEHAQRYLDDLNALLCGTNI